MPPFDVAALRAEFPSLARLQDGRPVAYLDGPGGTQVPAGVIEAVAHYYRTMNANHGGAFATSAETGELTDEVHAAVADLLGASAGEVRIGANMTTLTFHASRSITATMAPGDEIVVTTLDHEANVSPWRAAAADRGLVVRTVDIRPNDCTLDLDTLDAALSPRTRLVAFGYASNAVGTINPVAEIVRRAHAVGARTYVDAVHFAPHGAIDVRALGTDFLACSVYKWFGPHQGVLYGRDDLLAGLPAYKVRPAPDGFETGTPAFELYAGTLAAVDYLRSVGRRFGEPVDGTRAPGAGGPDKGRRRAELVAGLRAIAAYERGLAAAMLAGLRAISGVRVYGITDPGRLDERTPTFGLTIDGVAPAEAAATLGRAGIFAWDGDFYARGLIERLGLSETGGVLRLGLVHYSTAPEVERTLEALSAIAAGAVPSMPGRQARALPA